MTTNKRDQGRNAVEQMLALGMTVITINQILSAMPANPFTSGAYERLLDEQISQREKAMTTNKQLRELAEKAGSGHWYETGELRYHDDRSGEAHRLHSDEDGFIVAVCPATVLALLDEIESLQAECEDLRREAERYRWLVKQGHDFQWADILRVQIYDYPSREDAILAAMGENKQ